MRTFLKPRPNFPLPPRIPFSLTKNFATIDQSSFVIEYDEELYSTRHQSSFTKYYPNASTLSTTPPIPGHCNPRDSKYYKLKSLEGSSQAHESNFSTISAKGTPEDDQIFITSIGIGTYQGPPDSLTDLKIYNSIIDSVNSGCLNFIDTGLHWRYQKSERCVGAAIKHL
jgi:hypothetical protein